jgi:tetratricopeptide (TPR) repeat protein
MWLKNILVLGFILVVSNAHATQANKSNSVDDLSPRIEKIEESLVDAKIISQRIDDLYSNLQVYCAVAGTVAGILLVVFGFFNWGAYKVKSEVEEAANEIEKKRTVASKEIDEHVDHVKATATMSIETIMNQVGDINSLPVRHGAKDISTNYTSEIQEQISSEKKEGLERALEEIDTATDKLLSSFPKEIIFAAAYQANLKEQYNKAMSLYDKFLKMNPNSSEGHNNLGLACSNLGLFSAAIEFFDKAIQLDPSNLVAHFNKAEVFFKRSEYNEALILFEKISIIEPDFADTFNYKGLCHEKLGDFKRALACYTKAHEISPNKKIFLYNIFGALILNGKIAKAREMIELEDAHTPTAHTAKLLGHTYLIEGNQDKAKNFYESAFSKLDTNDKVEFLNQIANSDIEISKNIGFIDEEAFVFLKNWVESKRTTL